MRRRGSVKRSAVTAGLVIVLAVLAAALASPGAAWAQDVAAQSAEQEVTRRPVQTPSRWLQGFVRPVSGEPLIYPWAYPGQASALLSRTTDGSMVVEWEGAPVAGGAPDEPVIWMWHAGLASGYGAHRFTLSLNDTTIATFTSGRDASDREWIVENATAGTALAFKTTRVGTFNELFGFMILTAPRGMTGVGAPRFKVTPESAGSRDYYMTFQQEVHAWTRVSSVPAVLKGGRRAMRVDVSHLGAAAPMTVLADNVEAWSGTVEPGHTNLVLPAGPAASATTVGGGAHAGAGVTAPSQATIIVRIGGQALFSGPVALPAVRPWEIHLLAHSHVDIGYPTRSRRSRRNSGGIWTRRSHSRAAPRATRPSRVSAGTWKGCGPLRAT